MNLGSVVNIQPPHCASLAARSRTRAESGLNFAGWFYTSYAAARDTTGLGALGADEGESAAGGRKKQMIPRSCLP